MSYRSREPLWTWLVLGGLAAMACFVVALLLAPVRRRGPFVDWLPGYDVAAVEILGVRFHRELIDVGTKDLLGALGLAGIAALVAVTAGTLWRREGLSERVVTFAVLAAGAAFLAVDEILSIHETVGLQLGALRRLPMIDHPDNAIVLTYAVLLVAFAVIHRRNVFLVAPAAALCLAIAWVPAIAAVLLDFGPTRWSSLEEALETLSVAIAGVGIVLLAVHHLRAVSSPGPKATERALHHI